MAKLLSKPLTATIRDRVKAKRQLRAVPTIRPVTLPPVVVEPDRSLVERPGQGVTEGMAAKKKRPRYSADVKAMVVTRALKAKETGSETWSDIAKAGGFHLSNIGVWIKQAKAASGESTNGGSAPKSKSNDIKSLSRELADAMSQVEVLKKRLRKVLGE